LLQAEVREAHALNVELPGETLAVDQAFQVTLADGRVLVLHQEFQGRRSHEPMPWRMLEYMTRLAQTFRLPLWSVVIYLGRGAGIGDSGEYRVEGPHGTPALTWHYQPIRLWDMPGEELLALGRPALLAFIGQTRMTTPARVLLEVVTRLRQVSDVEQRRRLLTALSALISEEETMAMVERLIDSEELLLDTPFLRRLRAEGRAEGRQEGQATGALWARRRSILDVLVVRFDPPASVYQQVERMLESYTDELSLTRLLAAAVRAESVAAFQTVLEQERHADISE
jgi:predicted transposase YdaD